jgi:Rrf2 family transcriptional regulator, nitric oxide-sensitive transcriptional repressor
VHLTMYSDYALRLLMYLALHEERLATISEVATSYGISRHHLMKVSYDLVVAGYIETARGKGGGLKLAKAAQSIGLGNVVRHTEADMALVPCLESIDNACVIERCCVLRGTVQQARDAFLGVLDHYSLADLVRPRSRLQTILAIVPATVVPGTIPAS